MSRSTAIQVPNALKRRWLTTFLSIREPLHGTKIQPQELKQLRSCIGHFANLTINSAVISSAEEEYISFADWQIHLQFSTCLFPFCKRPQTFTPMHYLRIQPIPVAGTKKKRVWIEVVEVGQQGNNSLRRKVKASENLDEHYQEMEDILRRQCSFCPVEDHTSGSAFDDFDPFSDD